MEESKLEAERIAELWKHGWECFDHSDYDGAIKDFRELLTLVPNAQVPAIKFADVEKALANIQGYVAAGKKKEWAENALRRIEG